MERADSGEIVVPLPPVVGPPRSQCHRPGQAVTSETVHVRRARQCSGHACPNLRPSAPPGPVNDAGWSGHFGPEISGVSSDAAAVCLHPSRAPTCRTHNKPSPVKDTLMRGSAHAPRVAPDVAPPDRPHARARCTRGRSAFPHESDNYGLETDSIPTAADDTSVPPQNGSVSTSPSPPAAGGAGRPGLTAVGPRPREHSSEPPVSQTGGSADN